MTAQTHTIAAGSEVAPPDCGVCRRSLLVGERLRVYRNSDRRMVKVCELCRDDADRRGWESLGPVGAPRLRVQSTGSVGAAVDRDAMIAGLGKELTYLREQLGEAHLALNEQHLQGDTVRAITDKLRRQERELERFRKELSPERRAEEQRLMARQAAEIKELRGDLRTRDQHIQMLHNARQIETDPVRVCRCALDVFNSSPHADRMARFARTLGDPEVVVSDDGPGIPRTVRLTLIFEISWYEFRIKLDLGTGRASVHEAGSGGDTRSLERRTPTTAATWRESGLVLS